MANVTSGGECFHCGRRLPPQSGQGRRRRFCSPTCRAAAYHLANGHQRCSVRVGSRSCGMTATGFVVGRSADRGERIAACDTCRPAVEALARRRGLSELHWEPLPAPPVAPPAEPVRPAPRVARPPADYVGYAERRPYVVVDRLDELAGPTRGVVRLPPHLDWSPSPSYDLDRPGELVSLYQVVLREAQQASDLRTWLDADRILRVWCELYLPSKVRRIWEERFPALASARAAAA